MSLLILSLTAIPTSAFAEDTSTPIDLELSGVNVAHQETQEVSVDKLAGILDVAIDAIAEERGAGVSFARSSDQKTYDYITFDEQYTYFYEEAANEEPQLIVVDKADTNAESMLSTNPINNSPSAFTTAADAGGSSQTIDRLLDRL
ncbi:MULTISPECIES: hypothetical protein [unclassified Paenibacillus]|uniref:hypothetical protein n=1 Tax=unclassified Paenibacillus TaxID=185978 RepID=UPI0024057E0E|nr:MULTISPECIES: hypothetical protein [unclassified Paenibacillus]